MRPCTCRASFRCHGRVAISNAANPLIASSRDVPHISTCGRSDAQNVGRSGWPNSRQRKSSSSCTQGMPAGLPWGMPGMGEVIEGVMQQAPQPGRQFIAGLVEDAAILADREDPRRVE